VTLLRARWTALLVMLCVAVWAVPRGPVRAGPPGSLPTAGFAPPGHAGAPAAYRFAPPSLSDDLYGQPISEIRFQGNRRVESEAMLLELDSSPGELVTRAKLRNDLKRLWALGFFEDLQVSGELTPSGVRLTYGVRERPTVRKIIVEGNDDVKLDDINEVLDLEKNEVLDLGKVKANVEKVRAVYTEKGFFLAEVDYAVRPVEDEPGKVDIALVVTEASEVIIRSITFVGNQALDDGELRKNMLTRVGSYLSLISKRAGGVYNRDAFQQDYLLLRQYYADRGYFDADFEDAELALSPDRRFVHITVPVEEGPQYRIGEIRAREEVKQGESPLFPDEMLMESIEPLMRVGDIASAGKLNTIREDIERRYKDNGYAYVNVIPNFRQDRENLKIYYVFQVQKGPLVYVERVNLLGNDRTADKVIRREVILQEGDLYSESGKEASELRVLRLGYFQDVTVSTSRGSAEDRIILNIEVDERLTGTFQIGAGFSTIENFVLQAQVAYDNFLGKGTTVQLMAQVSSLRRMFNFSYFTRYFLDSKWNFVLNAFNSFNIFPGFERGSTGFTVSWGYPLRRLRNVTIFGGYNLEWVSVQPNTSGSSASIFSPGAFTSVAPSALIDNLFANGFTSAITVRAQYDTRDNVLFPTQGMYHQLSAKFASQYLGSDNVYNRYLLDTRFYYPVIKTDKTFRAWLVFRTRLQVGFIHSSQPQGVPIFERFFLGGLLADGGLRGFQLRSLGPRMLVQENADPTGRKIAYPIGGNLMTAMNNELEVMLIPPANIKGLIFFDVGNGFNFEDVYCSDVNPGELPKSDPCVRFKPANLRTSVGFGFRWQSPIGPLRFEWGFPLDRQNATPLLTRPENPVNFEFNVGTGF
jgi:outer membrane protein insertion porin family